MWETIKNDPILKTVAIIILSVLGFGFAFNIMFGTNGSGMGHDSDMGRGYSLENALSYILVIAVKVLLIVLVVAALIAAFKLISKYIIREESTKVSDYFKNDPILKWTLVVLAAILSIGLVFVLFKGMFGMGFYFGISGIIVSMLKVMIFLLAISLGLGIIMYIFQNYSKVIKDVFTNSKSEAKAKIKCKKCGVETSDEYKYCPSCSEELREKCLTCGMELKDEWKCCPGCGTEKGATVL